MARPPSSKASRLSAEERQLEQLHADILRQQQELEKKLKRLPVEIAAQAEQKRARDHQHNLYAGPVISSRPGRAGSSRGRGKNRSLEMPSRQRFYAQIKTAILLITLAVIFFLLWRSVVPST